MGKSVCVMLFSFSLTSSAIGMSVLSSSPSTWSGELVALSLLCGILLMVWKMSTNNDLLLSSWGEEDEAEETAPSYPSAKGRTSPHHDRSGFFDPVRGDAFNPEDELPWLADAVAKTPAVGKVDTVEDQYSSRWSMD